MVCSVVFQAPRRLSRRCCVSCTVKRIPSATPSWWGWGPHFPNIKQFNRWIWWVGFGGYPNILRSICRVSGVLCLLPRENIVYSYHPNSERKLDKKGWVWAKRSLMINYLWVAKNHFKIGRPQTSTLQQAIIDIRTSCLCQTTACCGGVDVKDIDVAIKSRPLFFYPPQSSQTNNSSFWLSTCVLQGGPLPVINV